MSRIAIIGAGSWGTALAVIAGRAGHRVCVWSRNAEVVEGINRAHVNGVYLPSQMLPEKIRATGEMREALRGAELVLLVSPSHVTRELLSRMLAEVEPRMVFVSATKGIEIETGQRMSEVVREVLRPRFEPRYVCLSGPSFAQEVASGQPTAVVAASDDFAESRLVQEALGVENFRIYTNDDVLGTETGGAVKNVMAVAAGMVSGLGLGSNSVAALITRGLTEMARLAVAQGARSETLMGLAGMGDLVLTCTGKLSRNRFVGEELGKGRKLEEILNGMREVAEGVKTTRAVKRLSEKLGVEMPITNEVYAVLDENKAARDAAHELMTRPMRDEFER